MIHFKKECFIKSYLILAVFVLILALLTTHSVLGQTSSDVGDRKSRLEAELKDIEEKIKNQRDLLQEKQRESVSLERDISILDYEISKAQLEIRARNISISNLAGDINIKSNKINEIGLSIEEDKQSLAALIRKTRELDSLSLVEVVLLNDNVSDFFGKLDTFRHIQSEMKLSFDDLRKNREITVVEKGELEDKKYEENLLLDIQKREKSNIEESESKKQNLLAITKGEEKEYKKILEKEEKSAAQIRAELFTLRDQAAIPFGEALDLAQNAFSKTGVRPALILGVIKYESNLGENVGTGNWKTDMKSPRDTEPFLEITGRLGLDPDLMPVSKKPWYGWGGAMGPAQFIPSTWILYEDKIADATGHRPPNPWIPEDAFMASAILLKDNGAAQGSYDQERLAALRYFAGWANAKKSSYSFYGDEVMKHTGEIQELINVLQR